MSNNELSFSDRSGELTPEPAQQVVSQEPISPLSMGESVSPLPLSPVENWALPVRSTVFPLHPNFWWALLWCLVMLLFSQVPGGIVAVVVIFALLLLQQTPLEGRDFASLMQSEPMQIGMGVGIATAFTLLGLLSILCLRIVAGRHWHREVALRRPAFSHVLLVLAATPAFIVLANAAYGLVRHPQFLALPGMDDLGGVAAFLLSLFAALSVAAVLCLLLYGFLGDHWPRRLPGGAVPLGQVTYSLLGLVGFVVVAWGFFQWLAPSMRTALPSSQEPLDMEGLERVLSGWPIVLAVLLIGVFPGVCEELWCRGFIGRGLVGLHGYFWGVLLSSFLFGLIHGDPRQGTMAMVLGVVLHLIYLLGRSLWLPILLHFLNNSLAVTLPRFLNIDQRVASADPYLLGLLLGAAVLLLLSVGLALWASRARLVSAVEGPTWQPAFPGVACPPPDSGTRVIVPAVPVSLATLVLLALTLFVGTAYLTLMVPGRLG